MKNLLALCLFLLRGLRSRGTASSPVSWRSSGGGSAGGSGGGSAWWKAAGRFLGRRWWWKRRRGIHRRRRRPDGGDHHLVRQRPGRSLHGVRSERVAEPGGSALRLLDQSWTRWTLSSAAERRPDYGRSSASPRARPLRFQHHCRADDDDLYQNYQVSLVVRDGSGNTNTATVTISVASPAAVHLELTWNTSCGDLDLHHSNAPPTINGSCTWESQQHRLVPTTITLDSLWGARLTTTILMAMARRTSPRLPRRPRLLSSLGLLLFLDSTGRGSSLAAP